MPIRAFVVALLCVFLIVPSVSVVAAPRMVQVTAAEATFDTEIAAQKQCPRDVGVWLNTPTGIYHERGIRWHGRTKNGVYICKEEIDAAGERNTRNGQ